jgi:hypothetical protein
MSSAGIMSFTKNMAMISNILSQGNSRQKLSDQLKGQAQVITRMLKDNAMVEPSILKTFTDADNANGDTQYADYTIKNMWQGITTISLDGDNFTSKKITSVQFGPWTARNKPTSGSSWNSNNLKKVLSSNRSRLQYCIPKGWNTKMYANFGSRGSNTDEIGKADLQYTLWYIWGAWFDEVTEQVMTAMMTSSTPIFNNDGDLDTVSSNYSPISIRESLSEYINRVYPAILSPAVVSELENFFNTGAATNSRTGYRSNWPGKELLNGPMLFTRQFLCQSYTNGSGNSDTDYKDVIGQMAINSPGTYPYYYYQYPETTIIQTMAQPSSRLSVAAGPVEYANPANTNTPAIISVKANQYAFQNTGASLTWQAIGNPAQLIEFTDRAGSAAEVIRSLSQFGSAGKTSGRMQIGKYGSAKTKATFPYDGNITTEEGTLDQLGYWNSGLNATNLNSVIESVYQTNMPQMSNFASAAVNVSSGLTGSPGMAQQQGGMGGATGGSKTSITKDYQELEVYGESLPDKPTRTWSPRGIKTYFSEVSDRNSINMNKTWLVIKLTPDQDSYNKIMKSWNKTNMGQLSTAAKSNVKTLIAQYPEYIEMAFNPGSPILIRRGPRMFDTKTGTDAVPADTDWLEWKWSRDHPSTVVSTSSYFEFVDDEDPQSGIYYNIKTPLGIIKILNTPGSKLAVIQNWFTEGGISMRSLSEDLLIIPWQINSGNPDFKPHALVDTKGVAVDFYQRSAVTYEEADLELDYPDAYTIFLDRESIEVEYFNADKLAKKDPILFAPIAWNNNTARELDLDKEYLKLELLVETNTDTYTGFDYASKDFKTEMLYFPGDERYLQLDEITFGSSGEMTKKSIEPSKVGSGRSISSIKVSSDMDLAKIEFRSGEEITFPDALNRFFSAEEYINGQTLSGVGIKMTIEKYKKPITNNNELVGSLKISRSIKNIPVSFYGRMADQIIATDGKEEVELVGSGGLIYEDESGNMVVILPSPDPSKGLVKFKLVWKEK